MSTAKLPKILIVDDEIDNLNALRRLLRKDFDVEAFESPREALDAVRKGKRFDCLLSDQRMPEMSGSKFFEEVIKIDARPTRILLTGFADLEAVIEAVNSGQIWRYISKPWEPTELQQTLKQACERSQLSRSLEESRMSLERALNLLRAKDWSRERLLQILLHEFRTLPQILEALKQFNESDPTLIPVREKFLSQIETRLGTLEDDVQSLITDEKTIAALPAENFSLNKCVLDICIDRKLTLDDDLGPVSFMINAPKAQLVKSLTHFIEIMSKNSAGAVLQLKLEPGRENEAYLTMSLKGSEAVKPKSLSTVDAALGWAALLEPFVGHEDLMHHSTGLRVETAHHVRALSILASRPDFSVSHDATKVDLVFSFRTISGSNA